MQLQPGANVEKVRQDLQGRLEGAEVLTKAEFRDRSLKQWLFRTGAGVALIGGALLGSLVGTVIVAQTLYSSTKDHLSEFATLRALGSSSGYIHKVILAQAGISAVIGYVLGMSIALTILVLSQEHRLADGDDAGLGVLAVRSDGRHVRNLGAVGDRQGHQDRSRNGIQQMTRRARPRSHRHRQGARVTAPAWCAP